MYPLIVAWVEWGSSTMSVAIRPVIGTTVATFSIGEAAHNEIANRVLNKKHDEGIARGARNRRKPYYPGE
jgi:hypothetical protein